MSSQIKLLSQIKFTRSLQIPYKGKCDRVNCTITVFIHRLSCHKWSSKSSYYSFLLVLTVSFIKFSFKICNLNTKKKYCLELNVFLQVESIKVQYFLFSSTFFNFDSSKTFIVLAIMMFIISLYYLSYIYKFSF